ncbi:hypothetical protein SUGI_1065970 [Cryptomeria japonica]|nr:hypothetical protein SUGI_1065970 [Cryptomeria japonica]
MAQLRLVLLLVVMLAIWTSQEQLMARGEDHVTGYEVQKTKYGSGSLRQAQCPGACNNRCSQTQYRKPCMFFCQKCCRKCLCVPPGYYGNKQEL